MDAAEAIVDERITDEDMKRFEAAYNVQLSRGEPSTKAAFDYALCLIRSKNSDVTLGIKLLEDLLRRSNEKGDSSQREHLYYLAVANTRIKEYDAALKFVGALLRVEAQNNQALALKQLIDKRMKRDALIGGAMIGGAAVSLVGAAVVAGVAALVRRR